MHAVTITGTNLYVGGAFSMIGKRSGSLVLTNYLGTERTSPRFPRVDGAINAIAPDGTGGYYIGGTFTYVAGQYRVRLAHILADGSLNPDWRPYANFTVQSLLYHGGNVYVGGDFTTITPTGGSAQTRNRWASLNGTTGELNSADAN